MAQIKTGTVSVENGSNVVTGSGTQWLTHLVEAGYGFALQTSTGVDGSGIFYTIGGSVTNSSLQLSSNWAGDDANNVEYVILTDYIAPGYPMLLPGDLEVKPIINLIVQKLINDKAALTALGSAALADLTTSALSTVPGRATKVGDYGFGIGQGLKTSGSVNDLVIPGIYFCSGSQVANSPEGNTCLVFVIAGSLSDNNDRIVQHAYVYSPGKDNYTRSSSNGGAGWSNWEKSWDTQNVAATAQNLLVNGTYGLGVTSANVNVPDLNADTLRTNGTFRLLSGVTGNPFGSLIGQLIHAGQASNFAAQLALKTQVSGGQSIKYRIIDDNEPQDWLEVYTQASILGTVSQSDSVPTGAIIERGSNANGEYVKFADGTLICTHRIVDNETISSAYFGGYRSAGLNWTFPVSFSGIDSVISSVGDLDAFGSVINNPTVSGLTYVYTAVSTQPVATRSVELLAIGRWY